MEGIEIRFGIILVNDPSFKLLTHPSNWAALIAYFRFFLFSLEPFSDIAIFISKLLKLINLLQMQAFFWGIL